MGKFLAILVITAIVLLGAFFVGFVAGSTMTPLPANAGAAIAMSAATDHG